MTELHDFAAFLCKELEPLEILPAKQQAEAFALRVVERMPGDFQLPPSVLLHTLRLAWLDGYCAGVAGGMSKRDNQGPLKALLKDVMSSPMEPMP